jgi:hypothetical protein
MNAVSAIDSHHHRFLFFFLFLFLTFLIFLFLFIYFLQFLFATIAGGGRQNRKQIWTATAGIHVQVCCSRLLAAYTPAAAHSKRCKWKWVLGSPHYFFGFLVFFFLSRFFLLPFLRGCVTHESVNNSAFLPVSPFLLFCDRHSRRPSSCLLTFYQQRS